MPYEAQTIHSILFVAGMNKNRTLDIFHPVFTNLFEPTFTDTRMLALRTFLRFIFLLYTPQAIDLLTLPTYQRLSPTVVFAY